MALPATAEHPPDLWLTASGPVEVLEPGGSGWIPFQRGVVREGQTYRVGEGGRIDGVLRYESQVFPTGDPWRTSPVRLHVDTCSAIKFLKVSLSPLHNAVYAKAVGQVAWHVGAYRTPTDDLRLEWPVGLEVVQSFHPLPIDDRTTGQSINARELRVGVADDAGVARLLGLNSLAGRIVAKNPAQPGFTLKAERDGQIHTILLKPYSQLAGSTKVNHAAPLTDVLSHLSAGERVIVYGVPKPENSLAATVIFPPSGKYIAGLDFVQSPVVPLATTQREKHTCIASMTLSLWPGQSFATVLPGMHLLGCDCLVGPVVVAAVPPRHVTVVPPPPAPAPRVPATAQFSPSGPPQLWLEAHGRVDLFQPGSKEFVTFKRGYARVGQTYRVEEGATLDGIVINEFDPKDKTNRVKMQVETCSAIRFITLNLTPARNTIYTKAFGQVGIWLGSNRTRVDDVKLEWPVGLGTVGRELPPPPDENHTLAQNTDAREVRVGNYEHSTSRLQGLLNVTGKVVSKDPQTATIVVQSEKDGQNVPVSVMDWSQIAKATVATQMPESGDAERRTQKRNDKEDIGTKQHQDQGRPETIDEMMKDIAVNEHLVVYGVRAASARREASFERGGPPAPLQATIIYPDNTRYFYGLQFVRDTPVVPTLGPGVVSVGPSTLVMNAGQLVANDLSGVSLLGCDCMVGWIIWPPPATALNGWTTGGIAGAAAVIFGLFHGGALQNASP
ncbi:MAG: hypothetical protein ACYCW6_07160 [Candidatus Xenobia bacterium]